MDYLQSIPVLKALISSGYKPEEIVALRVDWEQDDLTRNKYYGWLFENSSVNAIAQAVWEMSLRLDAQRYGECELNTNNITIGHASQRVH